MTYLITNFYINNNFKNYELRNQEFEKINIRIPVKAIYQIGDYVSVDIINGRPQILDKVVRPDNYLDYYKHSVHDKLVLQAKIESYVNQITNNNLKIIVEELLFKYPDFYLMPAAKTWHDNDIRALCEHTISMLQVAEKMNEVYNFNLDLVYSGIILHDLAKVKELEKLGLTYSVTGNLIGHIVMISNQVEVIATQYEIESTEEIMCLQHILLSHHGKLEYGAAKEPMTMEAFVVSFIDEFDAKMNYLESSLKEIEEGTFTGPLFGFEKRKFYKMKKGE